MAVSKIYIAPKTNSFNKNKYAGKLLVFDHVESMNHGSGATLANHPVEFQNSNIADHRFHQGQEINITGNISDNWQTSLIVNPTPNFQTLSHIRQKQLRLACGEEEGTSSYVYSVVNKILDGEPVKESERLSVPEASSHWVTEADRLLGAEKDTIEIAEEKGMSVNRDNNNASTKNGNINQIDQAQEMLEYIDEHNVIVKIHSLRKVYDNMVLTEFSNPLRNGPGRGAYWVSLSFQERLMAEVASDDVLASIDDSEFLSKPQDIGQGTKNPLTAKEKAEVDNIYNDQVAYVAGGTGRDGTGSLRKYPNISDSTKLTDPATGKSYELGIKENAYNLYYNNIGDKVVARRSVIDNIFGNLRNLGLQKIKP